LKQQDFSSGNSMCQNQKVVYSFTSGFTKEKHKRKAPRNPHTAPHTHTHTHTHTHRQRTHSHNKHIPTHTHAYPHTNTHNYREIFLETTWPTIDVVHHHLPTNEWFEITRNSKTSHVFVGQRVPSASLPVQSASFLHIFHVSIVLVILQVARSFSGAIASMQ
jgi:hypothetical protein